MKVLNFFNPLIAGVVLALVISVSANAGTIEYIDASPANTSTPPADWDIRGNGNGGVDGQYTSGDSSNFANEGSVLQLQSAASASTEFVTTITGLDAGKTYNIYGFFWDAIGGGQRWDLAAGLSSGVYKEFGANIDSDTSIGADPAVRYDGTGVNGVNVLGQGSDDFSDFVDGNRTLWYGLIGQVSGATTVPVYINGGSTDPTRTWYDGVGFELVPEPSSLVLFGFGAIAFFASRKRS